MNRHYTMFWNEVTETYNAILPEVRKMLSTKEHIPLNHLLLLLYGISEGEVIDPTLNEKIERKILESLQRKKVKYEDQDIIYGIQGLANSVLSKSTKKKVFKALNSQMNKIKVENLNLDQKLRLAWGISVLEEFNSNLMFKLVRDFENMPFEHAVNELSHAEFKRLRDIYFA